MNDDQEHLARALRTLAHREPATPAPVSELVRRGRQARRRRTVAGAVAGTGLLSAALVVALGTAGLGPAATPPASTAVAVAPHSRASHPPGSRSLDARSVLLAAAETAAREPATSGRFWYVRERTTKPARYLPKGGNPMRGTPFSATVATTQDTWYPSDRGASSRTVTGQDPKVAFASAADEARWRRLGSPALAPEKPSTNDHDMDLSFLIGNHRFPIGKLLELPTTKDTLESRFRRLYDEESPSDWSPAKPEFGEYVWSAARDLLAGPISPGTRSALYRLLAEQREIRSQGQVTDALGRTGVALALPGTGTGESAGEFRLIVDDGTAELLAYEFRSPGESEPTLQVSYEDMGWVDDLGDRPRD
ncbi:CU044_5270 family protein [Nonomuraea sp. SMC257]|uniref:CU044_5270 family protein n=1 Tax=Nonomuraea montanisoli TaxID=2741721 RepID=A0A7Y6M569_9ACTN|nr:CU044_5270 family protein [Nonomuraea montanisoli]NUW35508.1 CU044_5270 family protein [Nonomuraea montanisoli]